MNSFYLKTKPRKAVALLLFFLGIFGIPLAQAAPFAYIANHAGNGTGYVTVIDINKAKVVEQYVQAENGPLGTAVSPRDSMVYVTNRESGSVTIIDAKTRTVIKNLRVGDWPWGIAVTPDGARAYVANWGSGTVSVIDTSINEVVNTINLGTQVAGVAIDPKGHRAYVSGSDQIFVINIADDSLVVNAISVGGFPINLEVNSAGTKLYVVSDLSGTLTEISTSDNTVLRTIPLGPYAHDLAIRPDGRYVYVAIADWNLLAVIDADTKASVPIVGYIPTESHPLGVDITPNGKLLYVTNSYSNSVSVINAVNNTLIKHLPLPPPTSASIPGPNQSDYAWSMGHFITANQ